MCPPAHLIRHAVLGLAVAWCVVLPAGAEPAVKGVRIGEHSSMTRFVLDLSERIDFQVFTLADPYRVVIDLPHVQWPLEVDTSLPEGGLVTAFRSGLFKPGNIRIVLDVEKPTVVDKTFMLDPDGTLGHRLVVDLKSVSEEAYRDYASRQLSTVTAKASSKGSGGPGQAPGPPRKPDRRKRVVVIDPGHGGVDPGTMGSRGTKEKTLMLAVAKEVRRQLIATGRYRVALTRESDVFMRLRDRIRVARRVGAELFISLHADSIRDHSMRGASVYTLSERSSDKEAAALAARENKADIIAGVDLSKEDSDVANILIDLAQRETMNFSARFADILINELADDMRLIRRTHRFAGFAVLKAPDVPSVLVELGYLSNRVDEMLLRKPDHHAKVARAILRAVNRYFALTDKLTKS